MAYKIKWKQSDYIKLGKAISEYNKKVSQLQDIEERTYLPRLNRLQRSEIFNLNT